VRAHVISVHVSRNTINVIAVYMPNICAYLYVHYALQIAAVINLLVSA